MTEGVATAVMAAFLPDRQQSARRGSRRNSGGDSYGYGNGKGNGNGNGNGNSGDGDGKDNDNGKDNDDGKDEEYTTIN
jgi:hypothetical protein